MQTRCTHCQCRYKLHFLISAHCARLLFFPLSFILTDGVLAAHLSNNTQVMKVRKRWCCSDCFVLMMMVTEKHQHHQWCPEKPLSLTKLNMNSGSTLIQSSALTAAFNLTSNLRIVFSGSLILARVTNGLNCLHLVSWTLVSLAVAALVLLFHSTLESIKVSQLPEWLP